MTPESVQQAVRVLYIAGFPRSGSTLLERILGSETDVFSCGELRRVWERGFQANELCSCGQPFLSCPFWTQVVERAFGGPGGVDVDRMAASIDRLQQRGDRWRLVSRRALRHRATAPDLFEQVLPTLYRAIASVSGRTTLVDSSKDSTYGLILATTPGIEVEILHLVRDSRAVAYSWQRRRRRPEIVGREEYMPLIRPTGTAVGWTTRNLSAEALRAFADRYWRMRYEDLVADPAGALLPILNGVDGRSRAGFEAPSAPALYHTVSGNPMRLAKGPLEISPDLEWMSAMERTDRAMVSALSLPLLLRYGYDLFPRRPHTAVPAH